MRAALSVVAVLGACVLVGCGSLPDTEPPRAAAQAQPVDVVVVDATGLAAIANPSGYRANLDTLLGELERFSADDRLRVALVLPDQDANGARLASLGAKLGPGEVLRVSFDVAAADGAIAAAIAGCAADSTDFPEPPRQIAPTACGQDFLAVTGLTPESLQHAWLWDLEPLQGVLAGFFRSDARRVYVFVSTGDDAYLSPSAFQALVSPQPQLPAAHVLSIVSLTGTGLCSSGMVQAVRYRALAEGAAGSALDACAVDWSGHAQALTGLIRDAQGL